MTADERRALIRGHGAAIPALADTLKEALGPAFCSVDYAHDDDVSVNLRWDQDVSFAQLLALSVRFGTMLIDFVSDDGGFQGSDVTPGDPASIQLRIRWAP